MVPAFGARWCRDTVSAGESVGQRQDLPDVQTMAWLVKNHGAGRVGRWHYRHTFLALH